MTSHLTLLSKFKIKKIEIKTKNEMKWKMKEDSADMEQFQDQLNLQQT